jgi:hypothetical protein
MMKTYNPFRRLKGEYKTHLETIGATGAGINPFKVKDSTKLGLLIGERLLP